MMLQQIFAACGKNELGKKMQPEMLMECRSGGLHVVVGRSQIGSQATAPCRIDKLQSTTKLGFRSHRCVELKSSRSCWRVQCELKSGEVASGQMDTQTDSHPSSTEKQQEFGSSSRSFPSSSQPCLPGIIYPPLKTVGKSTNIFWEECMVKKPEREKMLGQKGCVVWITGLSASGKSTLACTLDHALLSRGRLSYVLDGDNLRHGLNNNLGFSAEDRAENIRRVGEVAKLFADAGLICIASFISPYRKDRDSCRQLLPPGDFIEVYLKVPLNICEKRDPKGLYKLARAGKIKGFTGIDDPYEEPQNCEIVMEMNDCAIPTPSEMAAQVIAYLEERGYLAPRR